MGLPVSAARHGLSLQQDCASPILQEIDVTKNFKPGDPVQWNTPQGMTQGTVEKKLTRPTRIKGHQVAASADKPQYRVGSDTSGAKAAHKPDALTRRDGA